MPNRADAVSHKRPPPSSDADHETGTEEPDERCPDFYASTWSATVKVPPGDKDVGVSTGKPDVSVDIVGSKAVRRLVELAGYGGYEVRGTPKGFDIPGGAYRWGVGTGFPACSFLRLGFEVVGSVPDHTEAVTAMQADVSLKLQIEGHTCNIGSAEYNLALVVNVQ